MNEKEKALEKNLKAFHRKKDEMERHYMGKWVLFYEGEFINSFDTLDNVASEAIRRYGRGPYLIKEVGDPDEMKLPASVMFGVADHAAG